MITLLGLAAASIIDFDLFAVWGLHIRNHALGIVFTGLVIVGTACFWQPILGFFEGLPHKQMDCAVGRCAGCAVDCRRRRCHCAPLPARR
ncbi:hypothetical protein [Nocardia arthritidis]|uniref:hypothetical protein n=1 Tax=Nocardia arthritidis TaxID=228602 RepID=UPI0007A3DDAA|nr:hypothetical protein [Nocardia arthritidis]